MQTTGETTNLELRELHIVTSNQSSIKNAIKSLKTHKKVNLKGKRSIWVVRKGMHPFDNWSSHDVASKSVETYRKSLSASEELEMDEVLAFLLSSEFNPDLADQELMCRTAQSYKRPASASTASASNGDSSASSNNMALALRRPQSLPPSPDGEQRAISIYRLLNLKLQGTFTIFKGACNNPRHKNNYTEDMEKLLSASKRLT